MPEREEAIQSRQYNDVRCHHSPSKPDPFAIIVSQCLENYTFLTGRLHTPEPLFGGDSRGLIYPGFSNVPKIDRKARLSRFRVSEATSARLERRTSPTLPGQNLLDPARSCPLQLLRTEFWALQCGLRVEKAGLSRRLSSEVTDPFLTTPVHGLAVGVGLLWPGAIVLRTYRSSQDLQHSRRLWNGEC